MLFEAMFCHERSFSPSAVFVDRQCQKCYEDGNVRRLLVESGKSQRQA